MALGLRGAFGAWTAFGDWSPASLKRAVTESEDARVTRYLEKVRPGGGALYLELRDKLPEEFILFGLYPSAKECVADPSLIDQRIRARDLLIKLRLLFLPNEISLMPQVDWMEMELTGVLRERLFALDLGYPNKASLTKAMEVRAELENGTLWRYRDVDRRR